MTLRNKILFILKTVEWTNWGRNEPDDVSIRNNEPNADFVAMHLTNDNTGFWHDLQADKRVAYCGCVKPLENGEDRH